MTGYGEKNWCDPKNNVGDKLLGFGIDAAFDKKKCCFFVSNAFGLGRVPLQQPMAHLGDWRKNRMYRAMAHNLNICILGP